MGGGGGGTRQCRHRPHHAHQRIPEGGRRERWPRATPERSGVGHSSDDPTHHVSKSNGKRPTECSYDTTGRRAAGGPRSVAVIAAAGPASEHVLSGAPGRRGGQRTAPPRRPAVGHRGGQHTARRGREVVVSPGSFSSVRPVVRQQRCCRAGCLSVLSVRGCVRRGWEGGAAGRSPAGAPSTTVSSHRSLSLSLSPIKPRPEVRSDVTRSQPRGTTGPLLGDITVASASAHASFAARRAYKIQQKFH